MDRARLGLGWQLLLLACILGALPAATTSLLPGSTTAQLRSSEDRWIAVGREFSATVPPHTKLATNIGGKLPYHSRIYTIDLLGLTHKEIARTPIHSMGRGYAGHEKYKASVVMKQKPGLLYLSVLDPCPPQPPACNGKKCTLSSNKHLSKGTLRCSKTRPFEALYAPSLFAPKTRRIRLLLYQTKPRPTARKTTPPHSLLHLDRCTQQIAIHGATSTHFATQAHTPTTSTHFATHSHSSLV